MNTTDRDIAEILLRFKKVCVLGMSPDGSKPSQGVPVFLRSQGFDCVGVNPTADGDINGFKVYKTLAEVPAAYREFVDVFRRPEHIPAVVDEVLKVGGVKVLWLQLGITHPEAEARAEAAGIKVVSNRCPAIEYPKHFG